MELSELPFFGLEMQKWRIEKPEKLRARRWIARSIELYSRLNSCVNYPLTSSSEGWRLKVLQVVVGQLIVPPGSAP